MLDEFLRGGGEVLDLDSGGWGPVQNGVKGWSSRRFSDDWDMAGGRSPILVELNWRGDN